MLILQLGLLIAMFYFVNTFNLLTVWYVAGIYLILLGLWLFLDDGDIFVGFLWVIDLGVGLIFFIFVLHYSTFAHQKSRINKTSREFSVVGVALLLLSTLSFFLFAPVDTHSTLVTSRIWVFLLTWYDYYEFFFNPLVTDLNLLHDLYFNTNAFEFFVINFFLLYGIIASVLASFLVKRIFALLNYSQLVNYPTFTRVSDTYFIRTQDHLKQQGTSSASRTWTKKKKPRA